MRIMLTKGDDYPLHQTSEPIAFAGTDRNFYDRYFFNGYSADGSVFFAAAMGFYPQLGIVDASFCVIAEGVQHNLRASRRSGGERLDLSVGPIAIAIDEPLQKVTLRIAGGDGPLAAELTFTGRHFPIEEPRFIRRNGTRLFMDYTRMTQKCGRSVPPNRNRRPRAISTSSSGSGRPAISTPHRSSSTATTMVSARHGTGAA